ncbi:MAG: glycosyltransferase [Arcobacteraceae bacterium]|jgi:GT2 family glycosyltransferase|nr:glycosyltransferase [Arcobacteraceae bacterium]
MKDNKKSKNQKFFLIQNIVLNIFKLYKHINKHNISKITYHIKKGNFSFINEKIGFYTNTNVKKLELNLITEVESYETLEFKKNDVVKVSIVIPVYNQFEYTYKCLQSILQYTNDIDYEIIIADDVSSDQTIDISNIVKNIKVVRNEKNLGFLLNCNNAAKYADGKYIHFLNNDTQVTENWLSSLVTLIESNEKIGMVGSKLVYPDGRQQEAGGIIWNDASGWNYGRLDDSTKPEYNYVKEVDYISGASIMLSKKLWNEIGGFDERYAPAYFEDSDLAFEVRKHGYKVMFQPKSIVVHFEGISNGTDLGSGIKKYQVVNKEKFIDKWKDELQNNHFPNAENVFLARDRSKNKKHILIIDHYVPHYDQDAGSRTMWQYLKLFRELDYQVTFLGDNFYKHEPYTSLLEQAGIEILYGENIYHNYDKWLEDNCKYFNLIYLLRPHIAIKHIPLINRYKRDAKVFYNGTDFHFLRLEREYEINKQASVLSEAKRFRKLEFEIFNAVDVVLTISEYEKKFFEQQFPNRSIEFIPTFIYEENFPLSKNSDYDTRSDIMFVGGFGHTPNYVGIKWFLDEIWAQVKQEIPNVELNIVGSKTPDDLIEYGKLDSNVNILGFVSDEELAQLYEGVRVVIAPLTFGAGVKGKIIESIANGVPIVTTTIGAEGIPNATEVLSISDNEKEFAQLVINMYKDKFLWKATREREILYSKSNMSYDTAKQIVGDIFK